MPATFRYLKAWLFSTVALIGAVAVLNLLVDPYGLYHVVTVDGFNRVKSRASQRVQLFKRHGADRMHPNGVILGNSRAEVGLDPDNGAWPLDARPVYNLAVPGSGVFASLGEFQRALCRSTPRLVVMGLDFLDFRTEPTTADNPTVPQADCSTSYRDHASALLTISALVDSIATLKAQHEPYPASLTFAGFNPMRDYIGIARREGYAALFQQKNEENAKNWARGPKSIYLQDGKLAPEFRALDELVVLAAKHHIAVRFIIYPYHAQSLVLFEQAGLWPSFESWKRELVNLVEKQNGGADVELWDFSAFVPYADEPVPTSGDTQTGMRWYWEAGHFKKTLGDKLLARVFGPAEDAWGRLLTQADIEDQLKRLRTQRDAYMASHPLDVAALNRLVIEAISDQGERPRTGPILRSGTGSM